MSTNLSTMTSPFAALRTTANSNARRLPRHARVLAFARGWSPDREESVEVEALRQRVAALGVDLIVVGDGGVSVFDGDGRIARVDRLAVDLAMSARAVSAQSQDAAYLLDKGRTLQLAYDGTLVDALAAAAELMAATDEAAA